MSNRVPVDNMNVCLFIFLMLYRDTYGTGSNILNNVSFASCCPTALLYEQVTTAI